MKQLRKNHKQEKPVLFLCISLILVPLNCYTQVFKKIILNGSLSIIQCNVLVCKFAPFEAINNHVHFCKSWENYRKFINELALGHMMDQVIWY